jgi:glycosyltransferase involved in cell wall biosynthesis
MRVTHISPTAFGAEGLFGGGERYPLELARALAGRVETRLVTFGTTARTRRDDSGLEIVTLRTLFRLKRHPVHPVAAGLFRSTRASDIIHVHHMRATPSRQAAAAAQLRKQRLCVTDHGLGGGGWGGLLPKLFDRFLTVSDHSAATLGVPPERVRTIYGGADPQRFHPDPATSRSGVLFVGRLTPHKGIDRLLRAMPRGAPLTIVGTGGHDPRPPESAYPRLLQTLASERDVRFAGQVPEGELPRLHRAAEVFVLPSVHTTCYGKRIAISELLGLSVLEAMASATPVVASRIGGVPEIVVDGETGFLVEPGDVDALHDRIAFLLGNEARARRMGEAGRARVLEHFTWERCAERCLAAYEELVSGAE